VVAAALVATLITLQGADAADPLLAVTGPFAGCDDLDPAACLLPFPNDQFTVPDSSTATGRRVMFNAFATPRNVAGLPIRTGGWHDNDGFSPGSMVLTLVPGLDLRATWGIPDQLDDLSLSLAPDAPIVLLDADTGERHPFWSELDSHPDAAARRLLIVRPAVNLTEGHRYVVGLRDMRRADGSLIAAGDLFAAYRDGAPLAGDQEERRPSMERIFGDLAAAGVARNDLFLAWDFTVASERNLSERVLHMRDDAFAQLGDTDLADGVISGQAPGFEVTSVTPLDDESTVRQVDGTITVPNYLTPQVEVALSPPLPADVLDQITGALPDPLDGLAGEVLPVAVPGSRLNNQGGLPTQSTIQPTVDVPFTCLLPRSGLDTPARPILYGHGLLGARNQVGGGTSEARKRGFAGCAVDWWGMSMPDLANVAITLLDVSNFPSFADRIQQGLVNMLYLARVFAHPEGFAAHPAFRSDTGQPMVAPGEVWYRGDSQGGIMGGAFMALSPDVRRGVLGVPGMNYSTLLNRSVDWEGQYGEVFYLAYPDPIDRQIALALIQMLWDRAEANGYALHMTDDPLPNTPTHQVLLEVAFGDHQVTNVAAEVEGRTIGARLRVPTLANGLHWSNDPAFGFDTVAGGTDVPGSFLVYWHSPDRLNATPPSTNLPATAGRDPHSDPRTDFYAAEMERHFLLTGTLLDTCGGAPCETTQETRDR
jgi:hypothetical protein